VGFLGKWYIAVGAMNAGVWPVAAVILLSTVLTLAYVARILEQLYFTPAPSGDALDVEVEADRPNDDTGDHAVAADGGNGVDGRGGDGTATGTGEIGEAESNNDPNGDANDDDQPMGVPLGIVAIAAGAAVLAVLLGFAGPEFADALEPFLVEVLGQ
jgi:multicomponent Na+:H+ antiporter subunit D